jgi:3-hydroxyisobutyrate dehydrogenase-like beta-hydroxyacid dehydrogenase
VAGQLEVGVVGLGAMGSRMAALLCKQGHRVVVHDVREAAMDALIGAERCESPAAVAERVATVLLSLPDPQAVRDVALGPTGLIHGAAIRTCVDTSTTGPTVARDVAQGLSTAGIGYVDAPVSGGVKGAERGTLTVMAACDEARLEAVRPLLEELGSYVFHVGSEAGMGQLVKVLNNFLSGTALVATAEAVALGVKDGLDPQLLIDVFNVSSGRNSATAQKFPSAVLPRTFDCGFGLALMNKDIQLCIEEALRANVPMDVGEVVAARWADAETRSGEGVDCTEIVKLIEGRAGAIIGASDVGEG